LLRFIADFDHVMPDVLQTFKVRCQRSRSQRENVVWLSNYCSLLEMGVAESNGHVSILICSTQLAVWARAQYMFGQKRPRSTGVPSGRLQVAMHSQLPQFLVVVVVVFKNCELWPTHHALSLCFSSFAKDSLLQFSILSWFYWLCNARLVNLIVWMHTVNFHI